VPWVDRWRGLGRERRNHNGVLPRGPVAKVTALFFLTFTLLHAVGGAPDVLPATAQGAAKAVDKLPNQDTVVKPNQDLDVSTQARKCAGPGNI